MVVCYLDTDHRCVDFLRESRVRRMMFHLGYSLDPIGEKDHPPTNVGISIFSLLFGYGLPGPYGLGMLET